jgi:Ethanolamine utilization protein EutJ (predicted chaperonin)
MNAASALLAPLLLIASGLRADVASSPELHWAISAVPQTANVGDAVELRFIADIPDGTIVYSSDFAAPLGPRPARFTFEANDAIELAGAVQAVRAQRRTDKTFGTEYSYFSKRAEFVQKARLLKDGALLKGRINGQTCQEKDGVCALFEESFAIELR